MAKPYQADADSTPKSWQNPQERGDKDLLARPDSPHGRVTQQADADRDVGPRTAVAGRSQGDVDLAAHPDVALGRVRKQSAADREVRPFGSDGGGDGGGDRRALAE